MMLGAMGDEEFEIDERLVELSPGDVIVAFTDGAYEARNRSGRSLGLTRLRHLMRGPASADGWPTTICDAVESHRGSRAEDDVLIASLTFNGYRPQLESQKSVLVA